MFEKTRSAMTADGTCDDRIKLERLTRPLAFMDGASDDEDGGGGVGGGVESNGEEKDGQGTGEEKYQDGGGEEKVGEGVGNETCGEGGGEENKEGQEHDASSGEGVEDSEGVHEESEDVNEDREEEDEDSWGKGVSGVGRDTLTLLDEDDDISPKDEAVGMAIRDGFGLQEPRTAN